MNNEQPTTNAIQNKPNPEAEVRKQNTEYRNERQKPQLLAPTSGGG